VGIAVLLYILGFLTAPLQQIFLTQQSIKTPTSLTMEPEQVIDLSWTPPTMDLMGNKLIESDPQPRLWTRSGLSCDSSTMRGTSKDQQISRPCSQRTHSFSNWNASDDPFVAQFPVGYNTGLVSQFLPRINSSFSRQAISAEEFPKGCDTLPHSFYAKYNGSVSRDYQDARWSAEACMPGNLSTGKWQSTRLRQDFSESLYLNLSFLRWDAANASQLFKLQVDTTAGYFELPNYMNGQTPGPLLNGDPKDECEHTCVPQWGSAIR
jgi:hypothetical protein